MRLLSSFFVLVFGVAALQAADAPSPAKVFENQLRGLEREFVPLVEAMPADKFTFAPKDGEFKGVRNFEAQAKHVAAVLYVLSSAVLGEKNPAGEGEDGPATVHGREAVAKYVKDAFAYAHKAMASLTSENLVQETTDPFNPKGKRARLDSAILMISHSFDHYGQMVEYARLNNIIPPASR